MDTLLKDAPARPRRTLTATPKMTAAAQRLGLVEVAPAPPVPVNHKPAPELPAISQKATVDPEAAAWRRQRLEQHNALIMALRRLAPDLFAGRERDHPPLAIGIDKEIQAALPGVAPRIVSAVLRAHTGGQGYLTHLAAGEPRRHLDGSSAGPPTPKDAEGAAARLKGLARRKAQKTKSGGGATAHPAVPTRQ
jgi:hypothetical protein